MAGGTESAAFVWSAGLLSALRRLRGMGMDARTCAETLRAEALDVDRALWALVGRSPEAAAEALAAQAEGRP